MWQYHYRIVGFKGGLIDYLYEEFSDDLIAANVKGQHDVDNSKIDSYGIIADIVRTES